MFDAIDFKWNEEKTTSNGLNKYKCIKAFSVPRMDEDGGYDKERSYYIRKGSKWYESEENFQTDSEITLLKENNLDWLGISKETLKEYFEEVLDG